MSLYAGETVLITHTATLDGTELTFTDVAAVYVSIYDATTENPYLNETQMVWNTQKIRWEYSWNTPTDPTKFRIKKKIADVNTYI